jgi:hypothetical protein
MVDDTRSNDRGSGAANRLGGFQKSAAYGEQRFMLPVRTR